MQKVAIVCDWLVGTGGAERVVLELHRLFPKAPIYTSQYDKNPRKWYGGDWFVQADVRTLWLNKLPNKLRKFMVPLRGWAFSRLKLDDYDLVISVGGAEAKFVKTRPGAIHINYCHAPTHYYWSRYEQYIQSPGFGWLDPLARLGLKFLAGPMRRWDYRAAQKPDWLITNSKHTAGEIKKYYQRDSVVIHPPVDIERFAAANRPASERQAFVTAGRQTAYKKIDLAVAAANITGQPLVVIGRGPQHRQLVKTAKRNITFLTKVTDAEMPRLFGGAKGFIFPGIDDFGIVAVEAIAAGTPVLAYNGGGALEYIDKNTGMMFNKPSAEALAEAWRQFMRENFDNQKVAEKALDFSVENFRTKIMQFIKQRVK